MAKKNKKIDTSDKVVRGIRFRWDEDAKEYCATVSPKDVEEIYEDGYDAGNFAALKGACNEYL